MKAIGTHSTNDEKQLEDYLTKISDWDKGSLYYEPVGGGITNLNWRVLNKDNNKAVSYTHLTLPTKRSV